MSLQPHQQRVVAEKELLDAKLRDLQVFFTSITFLGLDDVEKLRLQVQSVFMTGYSDMLGSRINAFKEAP